MLILFFILNFFIILLIFEIYYMDQRFYGNMLLNKYEEETRRTKYFELDEQNYLSLQHYSEYLNCIKIRLTEKINEVKCEKNH